MALINCHDNFVPLEQRTKRTVIKTKQHSLNKENPSITLFIDPC